MVGIDDHGSNFPCYLCLRLEGIMLVPRLNLMEGGGLGFSAELEGVGSSGSTTEMAVADWDVFSI